MSIDYIRKAYGIDLKVGEHVRIRKTADRLLVGKTGKLVGTLNGSWLRVKGQGWEGLFHPADVFRASEQEPA